MSATLATSGNMRDNELMRILQRRTGPDDHAPEALTALGELYARNSRKIIYLCAAILRDAVQAEDATQETFLRVYRYRHKYLPDRPFHPWLMRIGTNCCLDIKRHKPPE